MKDKKTFPRGVHPPEYKELTASKPLEFLPPPEKVSIPLHQHFGAPAAPLVKKGDKVLLGQKIGEATALFSAHVHSSVSGEVAAVEEVIHPNGYPVLAVIINNDGQDRFSPEIKGCNEPLSLSPEEIRQKVKEAGIVGLGGAAFPTAVKLSPPKEKPIDTLIVNGCECEPYLTADHRLMLEFPEDIVKGAELARRAVGAKQIIFGIEDNKLDAAESIQNHLVDFPAKVVLLKTKYPQGAEKNLIYALLRREVPRGGLPFDVGVLVQNVGTVKAIWDACSSGKPLIERAFTVTGPLVNEPKNLIVRLGTPLSYILDYCGGLKDEANLIILGGPMMGLAQSSLEVPVIKGTSGLIALKEVSLEEEFPCIRCGRCVDHCPMRLLPTQIVKFIQFERWPEAETWGALDCVECGCCQYICPSKIRLVHWIRLGKNMIIKLKRKKRAA
ncbi:MAG: electron transport complex subunit RsxC [Candidatus Aminicenantes bacterium]|nr:electron transport complex subunit RsxC [Candidatus Aminicenantes bacterium]